MPASSISTVDAGKIAFILQNYNTLDTFFGAVGNIKINCADWDGAEFKNLIRMNKDAEVQVLCLLAFWLKDADLNAPCADICFEFSSYGVASKQSTSMLELIDFDEEERAIQGVNGWRRSVIYADLAVQTRWQQKDPALVRGRKVDA